MNKLFVILFGFLVVSFVFGQREMNNVKTENHKQINGTKISLIPPPGFVDAENFQGLQLPDSSAAIMVTEIPGSFAEITKGFTEEGLKTQGVILKKEELKANGYPGLFLTAEQVAHETNFSKYVLVFGDNHSTYMVNGIFPKEMKALEKDMIDSLCSVVYEAKLTIDPLDAVAFSVDTQNTKLKYAKNLSGSLLFSVDGQVPTQADDKTSFMVGQSLTKVSSTDKRQTFITRLKQMPVDNLMIDEKRITEIEIDGMSGYEIAAEGLSKTDQTRELFYQVMLFMDTGYFIIVGTAKDRFAENLQLFKKVARTFKRK